MPETGFAIFSFKKIKRWNYLGLLFLIILLSCLLSAILIGIHNFIPVLTGYIRDNLQINEFYVSKLVGFVLVLCSSILLFIIMMVDGEQKRLQKFLTHYTSKLVVKDYYLDTETRAKKGRNLHPRPETENSFRAASSVRPKASELEEDYRRVKIDGTFKEFYPENGQLKREVHYRNGKKEGLFRSYYSTGQLEQEAVYFDDQIEGTYRSYYEDGTLHQKKEYRHGKLHGVYQANDEAGIPFFEISYKDGVQDGTDKIYDQKGVLQILDTYKNGICINRKTYNEYGVLKFDQNFEEAIAKVQQMNSEDQATERESQEKQRRQQKE